MVAKPPLPDGFVLPDTVNGWLHAPESNRNGHVWTGVSVPRSVGVFSTVSDRVRVAVFDDRVDGFANKIEPVDRATADKETQAAAVAWSVNRAITWMNRHPPTEWEHSHVEEVVFDPPIGFVLDRYYLEEREQIVYYRQEDTESAIKLAGGRTLDTDPNLTTRAYLVVKAWRGSGNATIALAPWLRATDEELHEVVDPPTACGLAIALKLAREYIREETGQTRDTLPTGQSDLGDWS